ncbi:xylose isomerase [Frankia sp. R43]|uniref:sugar phosphate isomerase/epimerase family protein n=1 Tax=Frankia sp. R43 TaxID=269536 RepID=UPI0006CA4880|nr:sugar phosphate isomerase/epimerase [Frankia sp. R43]KPM54479.1 xylose isomerase [Frankia sp. R43]
MTVISAPTLLPLGHPAGADDIRGLVDAVAAAGFSGVQMTRSHFDGAVTAGMAPQEYFDRHRDRGLSIATVEVAMEWATADRPAIAAEAAPLVDLARRAGAAHIIAITTSRPGTADLDEVAARLACLCDVAADQGLRISFEFLPWTVVPTLSAAARLLDAVNRDNLGLVLDLWHWFRQPGGPSEDVLRTVPPARIDVVQLCDAPAAPAQDPVVETTTARLLPGVGDIDIDAVLDVLAARGATPIIATEVYSASLAALGPAEMARRAFTATSAALRGRFSPNG